MGVAAAGAKASTRKAYILRAALVVIAVMLLTFLEANVSVLNKGLAGTPYLLFVAFVAIWGDYFVGALAVVACTVGLDYALPPFGLLLNDVVAFKLVEFLLAAVLIYVFIGKWRVVQQNNISLAAAGEQLQTRIKYLQRKYAGDKKKLAELSRMNNDLEELVNQFLQDEHYWQAQMEQTGKKLKLKKPAQSFKRIRP